MTDLRISTIQTSLHWENRKANLKMFTEKTSHLTGQTDLVVLPEMFTSGFSMNATKLRESLDGPSIQWMARQAQQLDAVITGSIIIEDKGQTFNRLIWMRPNGQFDYYDKRHLFTLANEHHTYTSGQHRLVVEWKGWKICPLICYDLRFPVWGRNTDGYDLLIYVANWPNTRSHHWKSLLMARAIENQVYTVGVNRIGKDEKGLVYSGDSCIIDYSGQVLYQVSQVEDVFTVKLSHEAQETFRQRLNFLPDQDTFSIID